ncbi:MAG: phosphatase family protein [Acidimicrobiia bacterium]|nr:phosphatase family protein [Acidimicrobiia bacterium]
MTDTSEQPGESHRAWIQAVFSAESRGRLRGAALVLSQIALCAVAFVFYLAVRAFTKGQQTTAVDHAHRVLHFEDDLQLNWERGAQGLILGRDFLRDFFNWIYVWTYWPMLVGTLVLLWRWDRRRFAIFRDGLILSGLVGLVIFALYPVAPPRMLDGFEDTVDAASRQHYIAHPQALINKFAALPSFHAGWVALAGILLMMAGRHWSVRVVGAALGIFMPIAVVVTANHYVVDVVAGVALSLLGAKVAADKLHPAHALAGESAASSSFGVDAAGGDRSVP